MKCSFSVYRSSPDKESKKGAPWFAFFCKYYIFFFLSDKNWAQIAFSLPAIHTNYLTLGLGGLSAGHEQLG